MWIDQRFLHGNTYRLQPIASISHLPLSKIAQDMFHFRRKGDNSYKYSTESATVKFTEKKIKNWTNKKRVKKDIFLFISAVSSTTINAFTGIQEYILVSLTFKKKSVQAVRSKCCYWNRFNNFLNKSLQYQIL